tara:strand:+ start:533 stop:904 length:372 start_codon:yes stop_codon:yes gene_type:complete
MKYQDNNKEIERAYLVMQTLEQDPEITQREIAKKLGMSLGLVNYCIKGLCEVGFIKMENFFKSKNKFGYIYILTPKGIAEKTKITLRFLSKKQVEFEKLRKEIDDLKIEIEKNTVRYDNRESR